MNQVIVRNLDVLEPIQVTSTSLDLVALDREVLYYKVQELLNGWERVYDKEIQDLIWRTDGAEDVASKLEAVIRAFDKAMIGVGPVVSEHQKVVKRLEALLADIGSPLRPAQQTDKPFLAKRRARLRKKATAIQRGLTAMRDKAVTPAWGKRWWQKFWGQMPFEISEENEERAKQLAYAGIKGWSQEAGKFLKLSDNVRNAFDHLDLGTYATKSEMLARHAYLIKIYHPDKAGNAEMAAKINAARDTLTAYYYAA